MEWEKRIKEQEERMQRYGSDSISIPSNLHISTLLLSMILLLSVST